MSICNCTGVYIVFLSCLVKLGVNKIGYIIIKIVLNALVRDLRPTVYFTCVWLCERASVVAGNRTGAGRVARHSIWLLQKYWPLEVLGFYTGLHGRPLPSSSSRLSSPLRNFWNHLRTVLSLVDPCSVHTGTSFGGIVPKFKLMQHKKMKVRFWDVHH